MMTVDNGTTTSAQAAVSNDRRENNSRENNSIRCTTPLWWLLAPYLVGLIWVLLHPIVSIATGEAKCRGAFIDEKAMLVGNFKADPYLFNKPPLLSLVSSAASQTTTDRKAANETTPTSLCDALRFIPEGHRIECMHHTQGGFDVARVMPTNAPTDASEAIVIVVNQPDENEDWVGSYFHVAMLGLLNRLAVAPWLAKVVLIVAPSNNNLQQAACWDNISHSASSFSSLQCVVNSFADAYWGGPVPSLPSKFTFPLIRTVLVLDMQARSHLKSISSMSTSNQVAKLDINVLPQGRRGTLPNLDLVFAGLEILQNQPLKNAQVRMHPFAASALNVHNFSRTRFPPRLWQFASDLYGMLAFATSMVIGPPPPHYVFLDHGIDALTIQGTFSGSANRRRATLQQMADFVQRIEELIRALSNLHEQLHHTVFQYLLPSTTTFVSNGEYTYPCVLILLPLIIRLFSLSLKEIHRFRWMATFVVVAMCWGSSFLLYGLLSLSSSLPVLHGIYLSVYGCTLILTRQILKSSSSSKTGALETCRSIQCAACCLAVYVHLPIVVTHISLALPSAVFWSPCFSMQSSLPKERGAFGRVAIAAFLLLTSPPMGLVPIVFSTYTPYVLMVFTPFHQLLTLLLLGSTTNWRNKTIANGKRE